MSVDYSIQKVAVMQLTECQMPLNTNEEEEEDFATLTSIRRES